MWLSFLAIAQKEFLHFLRNRMRVRQTLVSQVILFLIMGFLDVTVRDLPTVIVDQDHSVESRELVRRVLATESFNIKYTTSSLAQARGHIQAGRARVALVIPADYARMKASPGQTAHVLALVDGSDATTSAQAVGAIEGVVAQIDVEEVRQGEISRFGGVVSHSQMLFNPQGRASHFMLPGMIAIVLITHTIWAARSLIGEREAGNLERLLMTPLNYTALIFGKLTPFIAFGMVQALGCLFVMRWVFSVPIRGDLLLLTSALLMFLCSLLSLGMLVAASSRSMMEASVRLMVIMAFSTFLSGYYFPLRSLPGWLHPFAYSLPMTHMVAIMRGMVLRGASPLDLLPHFVYLAVTPIVFSVLSARRFAATIIS